MGQIVTEPPQRSLFRNTFIGFGGEMVAVPLALLSGVIINRWLGADDRGVWALVLATNTLLSAVLGFGMPLSLAIAGAKSNFPLQQIHILAILNCLFAGILGFFFYTLFASVLNMTLFNAMQPRHIIVSLLLIPLSVYGTFWDTLVTGLEAITVLNIFKLLLSALVLLTALVSLVLMRSGLDGMLVLWFGSMIVLNGARVYWLSRRAGTKAEWNSTAFRQSLRFGSGIYVSYLLAIFTVQAEVFILSFFQSTAQVGFYAAANGLASRLGLIIGPITNATTGRITTSNATTSAQFTATLIRRMVWLGLAAFVVVVIAAYPLIVTLYGHEYIPSVLPFVLLTLAAGGRAITQFCALFVVHKLERPHFSTWINASVLLLSVVLMALLSAFYGAVGTAAAVLATVTYQTVVYILVFRYLSSTPLRDILWWTTSDWFWLRALANRVYSSIAHRFRMLVYNMDK